jgi:hypothetical protein
LCLLKKNLISQEQFRRIITKVQVGDPFIAESRQKCASMEDVVLLKGFLFKKAKIDD